MHCQAAYLSDGLVERPEFFWFVLQLAHGFPVNKNEQLLMDLLNNVGSNAWTLVLAVVLSISQLILGDHGGDLTGLCVEHNDLFVDHCNIE